MRLRVALVGLLLVVLAAMAPVAGLAASPSLQESTAIDMEVEAYFGGYYKYGEWLPLRVRLNNQGGDADGELRTSVSNSGVTTSYAVPAPLPAGAQKEITLYVLLPSYAREVKVELVQGDQVLAAAPAQVNPVRNINYMIGLIAADPEPYSLADGLDLSDSRRLVRAIPLELSDLPERAQALRTFDALVIGDLDTLSLSPTQNEALRLWVSTGGRLVLAGGPGAERTLAGLPGDLKPEGIERVTLDDMTGFAEYADTTGPSAGEYVAALPAGSFGRSLLAQGERALISEKRIGEGWVNYLAFDPALSPFEAWAGMRSLWDRLLSPGSTYPSNIPPDISEAQMVAQRLGYPLTNLPSLDLPSVRWLAILLGFYILLVGPGNYLLLRRLGRLDWAWLSIPALTLLFAGGAFGVGYTMRGSDIVMNQISIIQKTTADAPVLVRTFVGLFSPSRSTYDFEVEGGALVAPFSVEPNRFGGPFEPVNLTVVETDPVQVRDLQVNQWAMQGFQAETWAAADEWKLSGDLRYEEGRMQGHLQNDTPYDLTDVVLVLGERFARIGDVASGTQADVDVDLRGATNPGMPIAYALYEEQLRSAGPQQREASLKQSMLETVLNPDGMSQPSLQGISAIAWIKDSPIAVSLPGQRAGHQHTTLLMASLPLDLSGDEITLVPGMVPARMLAFSNEAGSCGTGARVYIGNGEATLEYRLPMDLAGFTVTALNLSLSSDGNPMAVFPDAELWDWTTDEWVALDELQQGDNRISEVERYVNPDDDTIQLRLSQSGNRGGGCFSYDLGVEARRGNRE